MGATAKRLRAEVVALRDCLDRIIHLPREGARRTDDGYPKEVIYDEYAYKRIVDTYREGARVGLAIADDIAAQGSKEAA